MFRVRRAARAAVSAAAAIASSDDVVVTWVDVMERIMWCLAGGEGFLVGGHRGGVFSPQRSGGGFPAAGRGRSAGADELAGGHPGPRPVDHQPPVPRPPDRG